MSDMEYPIINNRNEALIALFRLSANNHVCKEIQEIAKKIDGGEGEAKKYNGNHIAIRGGRVVASGASCDLLHQNMAGADKSDLEIVYVPKL